MQYDIKPTSMTNIIIKWYMKTVLKNTALLYELPSSIWCLKNIQFFWEPNPSNHRKKKSELHRIDCWWNCVNSVADLLWLGFSTAAFDLESERRPSTSMKSISRQLNCEIMLGVNRLYIYTGRDRVSLFDMTLKYFREHFRKIVLFWTICFHLFPLNINSRSEDWGIITCGDYFYLW